LIHDSRKTCGIIDGHFGKLLAIQRNVRFGQSVNELTVSQSMLLTGSAQTDDPQLAELATLGSTIAKCKRTSAKQSLFT
jgi:hypothetical protein